MVRSTFFTPSWASPYCLFSCFSVTSAISPPRHPPAGPAFAPGGRPRLSLARLLCRVRHQWRALGERLGNVLALAGDRLDRRVGKGLVHPRPFLEVVRTANLVRYVQAHFLQLPHERVVFSDLIPEGFVRRRCPGGLPQRDLPGFVLHHVGEHLLGEFLAVSGYGLRDGPAPDVV